MIGLSLLSYQQRLQGRRVMASILVNATTALVETIPLKLDPKTDTIIVRLKRPTTIKPRNWDAASTISVTIKVNVDGVVYTCQGGSTGGIRLNQEGQEIPEYALKFSPTWGYFGSSTTPRRLGEGSLTYQATVEVARSTGTVETEIDISTSSSEAPVVPFTNSVAFDAASSGEEIVGDGVLTVSHTSTGSDRAVFAGNGSQTSPFSSTSCTYGGTSMTEQWDSTAGSTIQGAGYTLAGQATGAQNVVSTLSGSPSYHRLGVISFTGVDQATPVGTAVSAASSGTGPSRTVASVNTDDMVVDSLSTNSSVSWTVGANQTQRYGITTDGIGLHGSTQPGSAGGVMSWTVSDTWWVHGAIAFKTATAAASSRQSLLMMGCGR